MVLPELIVFVSFVYHTSDNRTAVFLSWRIRTASVCAWESHSCLNLPSCGALSGVRWMSTCAAVLLLLKLQASKVILILTKCLLTLRGVESTQLPCVNGSLWSVMHQVIMKRLTLVSSVW